MLHRQSSNQMLFGKGSIVHKPKSWRALCSIWSHVSSLADMSPVEDLTSKVLSRLAKCPWHPGTQMDMAWTMIKAKRLSSITLKDTTCSLYASSNIYSSYVHQNKKDKRKKSHIWSMWKFYSEYHHKSDIKAKVGKQARLCISEISIICYCLRQEEETEGEQIREPCAARAQSAEGNASGKPPYPCSDLEDALIATYSRLTGQRCVEYQPVTSFSIRRGTQ